MVGEGTFAATPNVMHQQIGIDRREFNENVKPTLKLGVRFIWGPRPHFDFPFFQTYDGQIFPSSDKPWGYYHLDRVDVPKERVDALLAGDDRSVRCGYHFENAAFVSYLEKDFIGKGGTVIEGHFVRAERFGDGIKSLTLKDGRTLEADIFIDASGFAGLLIHRELSVPYISLRNALFCDRAVVGGWERRPYEPLKYFTTAETMNAGWCWQIEHEKRINRGYVFSS